MKILWVENNAAFAEVVLKTFLTAYKVLIVPSITQAKQELETVAFDVVLLDYDLDDGKGTELVSVIKALPGAPFIVAASSHAEGNTQLMRAGADATCSKMQFAQIEKIVQFAGNIASRN